MAASDHLNDDVLAGIAPDRPVVMVNLMRFKDRSDDADGTGWDAYVRYSRIAVKLIEARGGKIVWAGQAHGAAFGPASAGAYDYVALVAYPNIAAFRAMIASDEYAVANRHRENGCAEHVIIATEQQYGRFRDD